MTVMTTGPLAVVPPEPDTGEAAARAIVLGAGISGLVAAAALNHAGFAVQVVEQSQGCGGAHRSRRIGPYTFDVGSIFYERDSPLFTLFPQVRGMCRPARRLQRRISPQGRILHYPIEPRDILAWPRRRLAGAMTDLLLCRLRPAATGTVEGICRARLGATIYRDTGLAHYIARFHHVPPAEIDAEFFHKRMRFVAEATRTGALLRAAWRALRRRPARRGPPAQLVVRPAEGFSAIYDAVRDDLSARGVRFAFGAPLTGIARLAEGFAVETPAARHEADLVIGAMPLGATYRAAFGTSAGLESLDLLTLFVSAGRAAEETPLFDRIGTVLFNFHPLGRWKRLTLYSALYPELGEGRDFFSVEVTLPPGASPDPEAAFADFRDHLGGLGLLPCDIRLEGHEVVPDAYPLYRTGHGAQRAAALDRLTRFGIVSVGRQGRFEYLPTASAVIRRATEELNATRVVDRGAIPSARRAGSDPGA